MGGSLTIRDNDLDLACLADAISVVRTVEPKGEFLVVIRPSTMPGRENGWYEFHLYGTK